MKVKVIKSIPGYEQDSIDFLLEKTMDNAKWEKRTDKNDKLYKTGRVLVHSEDYGGQILLNIGEFEVVSE